MEKREVRSEKREMINENEGWRVEKQKNEKRKSRIENRGPRTEKQG